MFPIEKYKFYVTKNKIVAVSTFAGKNVRGVAVCDPSDEFSLERGKELAAAKCNLKIAGKRLNRATEKLTEANHDIDQAFWAREKAYDYYDDAELALDAAITHLDELLKTM